MSPPANLSHEKEFDLHEDEPVSGTHFHINGFAQRLGLTQRQKATQKWSVALDMLSAHHFWSHYIISPLARAEGRAHKQNCGFPLHPSPVKKPILNCVNANNIRLTIKKKNCEFECCERKQMRYYEKNFLVNAEYVRILNCLSYLHSLTINIVNVRRTIFLAPVIVKYLEKNLDTTKPRYSEHILPVPWPFGISRLYCSQQLIYVWNTRSSRTE